MALAEDMLQEAFLVALQRWPDAGVPEQPRAWLLRTARNKAIDRFRRDANFAVKRAELVILAELEASTMPDETDESIEDERLRLIFTCCHPALADQTRVALTLRTIGGLTTPEIARAFLVPEATMAQRLVRAKRKIKAAGIPYRIPPPHLWPERMVSVLSVIYFIFNEGYAATSGDQPTRAGLSEEAIRMGRVLVDLVPGENEAAGLLALMLLHDSRRAARADAAGNLVTLEHQDRSLWRRDQIAAGQELARRTAGRGAAGPYQIQASISAVHASAATYESTDWRRITALYDDLYALNPSPVIALNRAVALSFAVGPEAGLVELCTINDQGALDGYQPFHAAHADLLRRTGQTRDAGAAYGQALALTRNDAERRFLEGRLQEVLDRPQR